MWDVLVIGAGVVGCAVAQRLSRYAGRVAVLERGHDVSAGASKANSGIVHAGFDAHPGSEKARLNVKGARMYPALCAALGVPYGQPGALVLAFDESDISTLETLKRQGDENGVLGVRVITREEALQMEPHLSPDVKAALYAPTSGLVSPYEITCALADSACENGVEFALDTEVTGVAPCEGGFVVRTPHGDWHARAVVNCAGVGSGVIHNMLSTRPVEIIPRKGEYYLLDHTAPALFSMTIFQVPTRMGKGVLVSPTTHGNLLLGPSADDVADGLNTATTRAGLDFVLSKCRLIWKEAQTRGVITTFSGVRAHEKSGDFIIGAVEGAPEGAFEAVGIESPGLSAAPAIGEELGDWVATWAKMPLKTDYRQPTPLPKPFSHMTSEEREAAWRADPEYGRVVCRCEQVTEAEIRRAIRRPVGARSIDGVKRRTRAGMGRCQGGFCSPRVLEILCEELGCAPTDITKDGGEGKLLTTTIDQVAKEAHA